jgi:hypothetical protein
VHKTRLNHWHYTSCNLGYTWCQSPADIWHDHPSQKINTFRFFRYDILWCDLPITISITYSTTGRLWNCMLEQNLSFVYKGFYLRVSNLMHRPPPLTILPSHSIRLLQTTVPREESWKKLFMQCPRHVLQHRRPLVELREFLRSFHLDSSAAQDLLHRPW